MSTLKIRKNKAHLLEQIEDLDQIRVVCRRDLAALEDLMDDAHSAHVSYVDRLNATNVELNKVEASLQAHADSEKAKCVAQGVSMKWWDGGFGTKAGPNLTGSVSVATEPCLTFYGVDIAPGLPSPSPLSAPSFAGSVPPAPPLPPASQSAFVGRASVLASSGERNSPSPECTCPMAFSTGQVKRQLSAISEIESVKSASVVS